MTDRIYLSAPDVGAVERELLLDAFDSNWIAPLGPHVDALERELAIATGREDCAALSSGTAALHLALIGLGTKPGDVVVTSTQTFCATANAAIYVGAEPVFVDSCEDTWTMDPALLDTALESLRALGRRVAAVVPVDLYGQMADYTRLQAIASRYDVPLVSDAAESLGASSDVGAAGSPGIAAIVSFNGNKIITGSTGGALVSDDGDLIRRARHLSTQAREQATHYEHAEVGFNYRMSNLVAAVVRGQLQGLTQKISRRRENRDRYEKAFVGMEGLTFLPVAKYGEPNHWLTCIRLAGGATARDALIHSLSQQDIEARPTWKPMHLQPVHAGRMNFGGKVAEAIFHEGICLPSGSGMTDTQLDRVINVALTHLEGAHQ